MTAFLCAIPIIVCILAATLLMAACTLSGQISQREEDTLGIRRS